MSTGSLTQRIAHVLAEKVAPALKMDGADLQLIDVSDGVVRLRLHGGCFT